MKKLFKCPHCGHEIFDIDKMDSPYGDGIEYITENWVKLKVIDCPNCHRTLTPDEIKAVIEKSKQANKPIME